MVLCFFHWKLSNIAQQLSATLESEAVMTSLSATLHQQNRVFSVAHSSLIKSSGVVQCRVCFYIPSKSNSCGQTRVSSISTVVRGSYLNQYENLLVYNLTQHQSINAMQTFGSAISLDFCATRLSPVLSFRRPLGCHEITWNYRQSVWKSNVGKLGYDL